MKTSCALRRDGRKFRCPNNYISKALIAMDRRRICVRHEAHPAACFVLVRGPYRDAFFGLKGSL